MQVDGAKEQAEQLFLSTGGACRGCWVCSAFLWPGQGLCPTSGYGCCKARKGRLGIFARVWKLYVRLFVGHGTVKCNCTLQLMQLGTASSVPARYPALPVPRHEMAGVGCCFWLGLTTGGSQEA